MTSFATSTPHAVIDFWRASGPSKWFRGGNDFDRLCRDQFEAAHLQAAARGLDAWADTVEGLLALILLLDQIPRNIYRATAHAFATDPLALHWARRAVERGDDRAVAADLRVFVYLPFEHSEVPADQDRAVALIQSLSQESGNAEWLRFALAHREVIERFGRFPHRNAALARVSTPEEQAWLDAGGGF